MSTPVKLTEQEIQKIQELQNTNACYRWCS